MVFQSPKGSTPVGGTKIELGTEGNNFLLFHLSCMDGCCIVPMWNPRCIDRFQCSEGLDFSELINKVMQFNIAKLRAPLCDWRGHSAGGFFNERGGELQIIGGYENEQTDEESHRSLLKRTKQRPLS